MKRTNLVEMSTPALVMRFAHMGIAQDEAMLQGDTAKFSRLFVQMDLISKELKRRDGDQRRALMTLYDHPNMQVRLKAAKHTLAVASAEARQQLEAIAESKWFPQAGDAGMSLWNLERGVFKPT
ncbi:DUF2019 domain-containing protein [Rhodopseudomonas palustris]|uniref:DUF2019 domain-containing protein n=1 Tax=Rhodopseudomonas palustris (strain BisB18) TaxID=316056 RepID=Q217R9_RHOPB